MPPIDQLQNAIGQLVRRFPAALNEEKGLQHLVARALDSLQLKYTKEEAISRRERPDFLLSGSRVAIEIKKGKAGMAELRQVGRYIEHPDIESVIVVATRFAQRVHHLAGKRIHYIDLWMYQV